MRKMLLFAPLLASAAFLLATPLLLFMTSCEEPDVGRPEAFGESISFRSFLQSHVLFLSSNTAFIVLRNKDNEQAFVDTMIRGGWVFPDFSYEDSMLVGIITGEYLDIGLVAASSDSFSIDSLIAYTDTIKVYSHLYIPHLRTDDALSISHFVVIPETDKIFQFLNVAFIYEDPY